MTISVALLKRTLPESFYERSAVQVAPELLGKLLIVCAGAQYLGGRIIEAEAYRAEGDAASHAFRGKTPRNEIMFGKPGRAYVYFIYGMYDLFNVITEPEGIAGGVLIRALEPLYGIDQMRANLRQPKAKQAQLCSGPGKLCKALGITCADKGEVVCGPRIFIIDDGFKPKDIATTSRIGITKGQEKLWRFLVQK